MQALLGTEGTLLFELREHVTIVTDPLPSTLSSSALRALVAQVRPAQALSISGSNMCNKLLTGTLGWWPTVSGVLYLCFITSTTQLLSCHQIRSHLWPEESMQFCKSGGGAALPTSFSFLLSPRVRMFARPASSLTDALSRVGQVLRVPFIRAVVLG